MRPDCRCLSRSMAPQKQSSERGFIQFTNMNTHHTKHSDTGNVAQQHVAEQFVNLPKFGCRHACVHGTCASVLEGNKYRIDVTLSFIRKCVKNDRVRK